MRRAVAAVVVLLLLALLAVLVTVSGGSPPGDRDRPIGLVPDDDGQTRRERRRKDSAEPHVPAPEISPDIPPEPERLHPELTTTPLLVIDPEGAVVARPRRFVKGRAIDEDGKPLAGLQIILWSTWLPDRVVDALGVTGGVTPHLDARVLTGEDGGFSLPYHDGGDTLLVINIEHDERLRLRGVSDEAFLDVVIPSEGPELTGRVTSSVDGTGIAGATVQVRWSALPGVSQFASPEVTWLPLTTDAEGRWRTRAAPTGAVGLRVAAPGFAPRFDRFVTVGAGAGWVMETVLSPGITVVGRVTEAGADRGVAGAIVRLHTDWVIHSPSAVTDGDGRFRLGPVAAEPMMFFPIRASADGFAETTVHVGIMSADETETDAEIVLRRAASVRVRCLDAAGRAAAGTLVHVQSEHRTGSMTIDASEGAALTDDGGRVHIEDLHPGTEGALTVSFYRDGILVHSLTPPPLEPGETRDLGHVVLGRPRALRGRVKDEDGEAVPGVALIAVLQGDQGTDVRAIASAFLGGKGRRATTDAAGEFVIQGLYAGTWDVYVDTELFADHLVRGIVVGTSDDPFGVAITLSPGIVLEGSVLHADGAPIEGANVLLQRADPIPLYVLETATTDDQGRFSFPSFPPGARDVGLTVVTPGGRSVSLKAQPAESPVEIRLPAE